MKGANIGTALLKSNGVILLEKEKVLAAANKAKIQIIGF